MHPNSHQEQRHRCYQSDDPIHDGVDPCKLHHTFVVCVSFEYFPRFIFKHGMIGHGFAFLMMRAYKSVRPLQMYFLPFKVKRTTKIDLSPFDKCYKITGFCVADWVNERANCLIQVVQSHWD